LTRLLIGRLPHAGRRGEPGQLQIDQAQHHLRGAHPGAERERPTLRDLLEQIDRLAVFAPAPVDQAGGMLE
jgi:hypothetical protein